MMQLPLTRERAQAIIDADTSLFRTDYQPHMTYDEVQAVRRVWRDPSTPGSMSFNDVVRKCARASA